MEAQIRVVAAATIQAAEVITVDQATMVVQGRGRAQDRARVPDQGATTAVQDPAHRIPDLAQGQGRAQDQARVPDQGATTAVQDLAQGLVVA